MRLSSLVGSISSANTYDSRERSAAKPADTCEKSRKSVSASSSQTPSGMRLLLNGLMASSALHAVVGAAPASYNQQVSLRQNHAISNAPAYGAKVGVGVDRQVDLLKKYFTWWHCHAYDANDRLKENDAILRANLAPWWDQQASALIAWHDWNDQSRSGPDIYAYQKSSTHADNVGHYSPWLRETPDGTTEWGTVAASIDKLDENHWEWEVNVTMRDTPERWTEHYSDTFDASGLSFVRKRINISENPQRRIEETLVCRLIDRDLENRAPLPPGRY